jgi:hypothetical protein
VLLKFNGTFLFIFQYIRRCLMRDQLPQLMLMSRESLYENLVKSQFIMPSYVKMGACVVHVVCYTCLKVERS